MLSAENEPAQNTGWQAELSLSLEPRPGKTVVAQRRQRGPLAIQRPFYPEGDLCHLYLLHPPGGVVGGDQLQIEANVMKNAAALVTTPGATKFYRSNGLLARQTQILRVAKNATLEWVPQENIFFPGAHCQLATEIHLEANAGFMGWEVQCLGRPANDERFNPGFGDFRLRLQRDNRPILIERFTVGAENPLEALSGLRGNPVLGTMIATGVDKVLLESLQTQFSSLPKAETGFTLLEDILVCRYLGHSTEQARKLFAAVWEKTRPHCIQRQACTPRIWLT